ncbi:hypothetical protein MTO96_049971 [Rhipicephalus appendiculatus]
MAFRWQGRRPVALGYARFVNPEQPTSAVKQEESVTRVDELRLANLDSVTSDRLRQDWSRLRAATATDARNFERIALMDRKFEGRKGKSREAAPTAPDSLESAASPAAGIDDPALVPLPSTSHGEEFDVSATWRKRGRDDDVTDGPRNQPPTNTVVTPSPDDFRSS